MFAKLSQLRLGTSASLYNADLCNYNGPQHWELIFNHECNKNVRIKHLYDLVSWENFQRDISIYSLYITVLTTGHHLSWNRGLKMSIFIYSTQRIILVVFVHFCAVLSLSIVIWHFPSIFPLKNVVMNVRETYSYNKKGSNGFEWQCNNYRFP